MANTDKFKSWWASLTPDRRRVYMAASSLVVLLGVLYMFVSAGPDEPSKKGNDSRPDVNLLTGSDARSLGIDALGAELRATQRTQRELEARIEKLREDAGTKKDLDRISSEIQALTQNVGSLRDSNLKAASSRSASDSIVPGGTATSTGTPSAENRGLFDQPDIAPAPVPPGTRPGANASAPGARSGEPEVIKVRVIGQGDETAANKPRELPNAGDLYLPAGSILKGVLLTGVDAPTGLQSRRDPIPALMRVKREAILPNRFQGDVRECFVVFGATGDLSTERALLRAETLSCIRIDGGVIETALDAYAMGDDGKAGIRGRLVSRNGSLVAKAMFASFAEALSQIFRPVMVQGFNTQPGNRTQFQAPDTGDALEASGYAGLGGAMHRLSDYFVDLADEIVPFIEVDAARQIEAVLLKGVSLKIRGEA